MSFNIEKQFSYGYLPGSHLLQTLTMPCNMTLTQSYESQRDLLIGMAYHRGNTLVTQRSYSYDSLGRPLTRSTARNGQTVSDSFGYNTRSELTSATVNGINYGYAYDNIGNRNSATQGEEVTAYTANELNQYTAVGAFTPTFDADGNQTLVQTATGIWSVEYNAENRPVRFTSADGSTLIECSYDTMGRRATKKVTTNGSVTLHQRYIYRGYLQIAACDLTRAAHPALWFITWDPTQPIATLPLAIRKDGTWFAYGWDLTKNICEVFGPAGYIRTAYSYSPYGSVTATGDVTQPIQWSSEYNDAELALVYYNYRHYNPVDGRWMGRDRIAEWGGLNLYRYVANNAIVFFDSLGLDYTVEVDKKKCTITFKLVIVLTFDETVPTSDQPLIKQQVKDTIESEWSGHKKGCCTVNVEVEIRDASIWNSIEDVFTPKGRENNYMKVTYDQTKGHDQSNQSYVNNSQTGVYVSSPSEVRGSHNPRKDYATWSYAHEAGHLLHLEDGYYVENKQQKVKPNYKGNEMMTKALETVKQDDINRLTSKVDCPCSKK